MIISTPLSHVLRSNSTRRCSMILTKHQATFTTCTGTMSTPNNIMSSSSSNQHKVEKTQHSQLVLHIRPHNKKQSNINDVNIINIQLRHFGRKAGKMGQHLKTLNEMAHDVEHQKAIEKRQKNKGNKKKSKNNNDSGVRQEHTQQQQGIILSDLEVGQEDECETIFDHGEGGDSSNDNNDEAPSLPSKDEVKQRMMKVVNAMEDSFKAIRGAETTPELFDSVEVKAYGSLTSLNAVAQVVISSPNLATISCFDPDTAPDVRDAVRDMAGMNFNPRIEDGVILVPIPRVSAETRKALVKQLGKTAENTRQRIRRIRRGAQDVVKKAKDKKLEGISEDDSFRTGKEIDAVTEESIKVLNDIVEKKQSSVMAV